jgi:hypothetical protein
LVLLSLLIMFPCHDVLAGKQLTELQALDILTAQIRKDKLYAGWTSLSCLSFMTEVKTKDHFDFAIHEKHGGKCPGDPNTAPIVDRFRVNRLTGKILWYDVTAGEFLPYGAVLKTRMKE